MSSSESTAVASGSSRAVRHAFGLVVLMFLIAVYGCSGSLLEEPKWESMIVMSPGAFTLTKGDSTFIGFAFWLDRGDRRFLDCAPACIQRVEVFSPCWQKYTITAVDLRDSYVWRGEWGGSTQPAGVSKQYWHVEPALSPCEGFYRWEVEFKSQDTDVVDSTIVAMDYLTPSVLEPSDTSFYPPDSLILDGTKVTFEIMSVPIGGWEISLLDSLGDPVLASDWMWVGSGPGAAGLTVSWLEPSAWYSWKVRIWDRQRCNAWEMHLRRWFRTGTVLATNQE